MIGLEDMDLEQGRDDALDKSNNLDELEDKLSRTPDVWFSSQNALGGDRSI